MVEKEGDMPHYTYLIVGGGMTADAAIHGIREVDSKGAVGLIGSEHHYPYNRPPLTKGLWSGKKSLEQIWRGTDKLDVDMHLGRRAQTLDANNKRVTDDQGNVYTYDRLLLATGGTPRHLPFEGEDIIYYRTVDDYQRLRALTERGQRFAVIGGGFIGSEIAASLAGIGKEVVMVFLEKTISERIFPPDLAQYVTDYYRQRGVEVVTQQSVSEVKRRGDQLVLTTNDQREFVVDGVVAGIGIRPNIELAEAAGLKIDNGVAVDEFLRTSQPDIFAAGDVASFYNPDLEMRMRVEHEDNANTMGKAAGRAMAGDRTPYHHLPFFYSDLFDLGYEAVGELDSRLETVADWTEPHRKGVIYYMRDGRATGVLLWNVWDQVENARQLIRERVTEVKGRLPA
jgi:NADPH-dependent 2,4-dienoyl-CoA reductase/sulfur reductase-like enzyme